MSNFEAYPHFPVLKLRTRDHDEIPQLPKEILVEHVQLAKAHPMSVIEASLMGTIKTPPPRPQVRYLPSLMPIQTQFDILEARLDVLYQKSLTSFGPWSDTKLPCLGRTPGKRPPTEAAPCERQIRDLTCSQSTLF